MSERKIILNLATSLDGFIEGTKGEYNWCFTDQDYGFNEFIESIDTIFLGKKSYELFKSDIEVNFPGKKLVVFSTTLQDENIKIIRKNITAEIEKIKSEQGKNIWMFGGASLSKTLMDLQLIDQIQMGVHPIILGGGTPLFHKSDRRIKLELISNEKFSSGMIILKYNVRY